MIEPTETQMADAREMLAARPRATFALHYIGSILERVAAADWPDPDSLRRALATYRVWDVEFDRGEPARERLLGDLPGLEFPAEAWGSSAAEVKP